MINGYDRTLQEILLEQDRTGWRMLVGCVLLNQTSRAQVDGVREDLFRMYRSPEELAHASVDSLADVVRPLGFQNCRARTLRLFSEWWVSTPYDHSEGVLALEPPGVGEYARDSWEIFYIGIVPDHPVADKVLLEYLVQKNCYPPGQDPRVKTVMTAGEDQSLRDEGKPGLFS